VQVMTGKSQTMEVENLPVGCNGVKELCGDSEKGGRARNVLR
jgi:hypothetical protein